MLPAGTVTRPTARKRIAIGGDAGVAISPTRASLPSAPGLTIPGQREERDGDDTLKSLCGPTAAAADCACSLIDRGGFWLARGRHRRKLLGLCGPVELGC